MIALLLSWTLLALSPQDQAQDFRNKTILELAFDAPPSENISELLSLIDIQPGYLFNSEMLREAIKRLYTLERFSDVKVYIEPLNDVVILHFELPPKRWLTEFSFKGLNHVNKHELQNTLKINIGETLDNVTKSQNEAHALAYLKRIGFPDAKVEILIKEKNLQSGAEIWQMVVDEGEPLRVKDFEFKGEPRLPNIFLESLLKTNRGTIANRLKLEQDHARLLTLYREHGFLNVRIAPVEIQQNTVVFTIYAGYRTDIQFTGNTLLKRQELLELWPTNTTEITKAVLRSFSENIKQAYVHLGYPNAEVDIQGFKDSEQGINRFLVKINEKEAERVADLQFPGATVFSQDILQEQIYATLRQKLKSPQLIQQLKEDELATAWQSPPSGMRSPIPIEERFVPEYYDEAISEMVSAYRNKGYLQVRIGPLEQENINHNLSVKIPIEEGPQTVINSVTFSNNTSLSSQELFTALEQKAVKLNEPYSANAVEDARIALLQLYREKGYAYARIFNDNNTYAANDENKQLTDISFRFEEGPEVRIRTIFIRGNRYTLEGLIRSQISLKPYSLYRLDQAIEDQRSIASLGVFSSVRVKLIDEQHPEELKDIVADVTERPRQPIDVGVGVSTAEGPRLRFSYSHINVLGTAATFTTSAKINRQIFFDLYGIYAERMRQRFNSYQGIQQFSKALERELRFGIYSPRLNMLPLDPRLRLDVISERDISIPYTLDTIATIFGIDFTPHKRVKLSIEPQVGITNLECDPSETSNNCQNEALGIERATLDVGLRRTFKVGPILTLDLRDSPFNPSRGLFAQIKAIYAIGESRPDPAKHFSDLYKASLTEPFSFTRVEANLTGYFPLWRVVFAWSVRAGTIFDHKHRCAPVDERFFLGGRSTLRGFIERSLLPEDAFLGDNLTSSDCDENTRTIVVTSNDAPVTKGGNHYFLAKSELRIPLVSDFALVLFLDAGNLWVNMPKDLNAVRLRLGTGIGIRYNTPVGALEVDLGANPLARTYRTDLADGTPYYFKEDLFQIHFSVGSF